MQVPRKVLALAATVLLAGAGVTAAAWEQPSMPAVAAADRDHNGRPEGQGLRHDHGLHLGHDDHKAKSGKDHGLHLGHDDHKAKQGKDHGLHLGRADKHEKWPPGHGPGLHLGHRMHWGCFTPPGLSVDKHPAKHKAKHQAKRNAKWSCQEDNGTEQGPAD